MVRSSGVQNEYTYLHSSQSLVNGEEFWSPKYFIVSNMKPKRSFFIIECVASGTVNSSCVHTDRMIALHNSLLHTLAHKNMASCNDSHLHYLNKECKRPKPVAVGRQKQGRKGREKG